MRYTFIHFLIFAALFLSWTFQIVGSISWDIGGLGCFAPPPPAMTEAMTFNESKNKWNTSDLHHPNTWWNIWTPPLPQGLFIFNPQYIYKRFRHHRPPPPPPLPPLNITGPHLVINYCPLHWAQYFLERIYILGTIINMNVRWLTGWIGIAQRQKRSWCSHATDISHHCLR